MQRRDTHLPKAAEAARGDADGARGVRVARVRRRARRLALERQALRLLTLGLVVFALPAPSRACSEPVCQNGFLVPAGSARVPANAPGFWWRGSREGGAEADAAVHVWQASGDADEADEAEVELDLVRTFRPATVGSTGEQRAPGVLLGVALTAGQRLRVEAADTCAIGGYRPFAASIEVTDAAPVPATLGALSATTPRRGPLTIAHDGGGCSREADVVYTDVSLSLNAQAAPWADLLLYETLVDGQPYHPADSMIHTPPPHESWQGRGRDRLFVVCDPSAGDAGGLPAGTHEVQLVGRLPGSDARIVSDTVQVTLRCPADAVVTAGEELYDVVSFQIGAVVVAAQLALLLYLWLTRSRRRRKRDA